MGFGLANNKLEYETFFLKPFRTAFTNRQIEIDVLTCEGSYCGAHGYLYAKHTGEFLGEPASNLDIRLRLVVSSRQMLNVGSLKKLKKLLLFLLLDLVGIGELM